MAHVERHREDIELDARVSPEAASTLLERGIAPLADIAVDTDKLAEQAEEIRQAKAQLAQQMQGGGQESTSARPLGVQ